MSSIRKQQNQFDLEKSLNKSKGGFCFKIKKSLWLLGGAFIGLPALGWLIVYLVMVFSPAPAKPTITYGEFPFKLVYEINGERKTIEDTLICEFDGIGWNEGQDKFRKWKTHLASGNGSNSRIVILPVTDNESRIEYHICYTTGSAEYYMGATDVDKSSSPRFYEDLKGRSLNNEELLRYGIKIISWEHSKPIVNEFK